MADDLMWWMTNGGWQMADDRYGRPRAAALRPPRLCAARPPTARPPRHHAPQRRLHRTYAPPELPGCCHCATTGRSAASAAPLRRLAYPGVAAAPPRAAAPHPPRLCTTWDPPGCCRRATTRRRSASAAPLRLLTRLGAAAAQPRAAALPPPLLSTARPPLTMMPRPARAMPVPCPCHARAMPLPCPCHARAMPAPCWCHARMPECPNARKARRGPAWPNCLTWPDVA